MIRERQLEGIAKAKRAGNYRGGQSTMTALRSLPEKVFRKMLRPRP